jgi:hypothetical protein
MRLSRISLSPLFRTEQAFRLSAYMYGCFSGLSHLEIRCGVGIRSLHVCLLLCFTRVTNFGLLSVFVISWEMVLLLPFDYSLITGRRTLHWHFVSIYVILYAALLIQHRLHTLCVDTRSWGHT